MKNLHKKRYLSSIIMSIITISCAALLYYFYTPSLLIERNQHYVPFTKQDIAVVQIYKIAPFVSDKTIKLYIVTHDNGTSILRIPIEEATPIDEMVKSYSELAENPALLLVTEYQLDATTSANLQSEVHALLGNDVQFDTAHILMTNKVNRDLFWWKLALGILALLTLLSFAYTFFKGVKKRNRLDDIYAIFPELSHDDNHLATHASFNNTVITVAIYKDHLIAYGNNISIIPLHTVQQIGYTKDIRSSTTQLILYAVVNDSDSIQPIDQKALLIKGAELGYIELLRYVATHYPNIKVDNTLL